MTVSHKIISLQIRFLYKFNSVKHLYLALLLSSPLFVVAQKNVDLDRYRLTVHYMSLPQQRLDSNYRTFHVEVEGTRLMQPLMEELSPEASVRLEGWRKMESGGHVSVQVKLGDLLPEGFSVKERVETKKNGNGIVTGTKTFYYQEVIYTFEAAATIADYKGMHIMDQDLSSRQYKRVYRSPEFQVKQLAEGYFLLNSPSITKELFRKEVMQAMHTLSENLTAQFGYREVAVNDNMWIIDSKKHPEYEAWRKAFSVMSDVLFNMDANTPIDGAREKLAPVINYFERVRTVYTSTKKHDRKIRYATYYNLAVLYYYLDDPQAMMREANGLVLNDYDTRDGKAFEQTAAWLKNLFQQNNIYTRHFPVNTTLFRGPYEKADISRIN